MDKFDFGSFATLRGYKMPRTSGDYGLIIAQGKLSDMVKYALALTDREYHGLTITSDGPLLRKEHMVEMFWRPDFPK